MVLLLFFAEVDNKSYSESDNTGTLINLRCKPFCVVNGSNPGVAIFNGGRGERSNVSQTLSPIVRSLVVRMICVDDVPFPCLRTIVQGQHSPHDTTAAGQNCICRPLPTSGRRRRRGGRCCTPHRDGSHDFFLFFLSHASLAASFQFAASPIPIFTFDPLLTPITSCLFLLQLLLMVQLLLIFPEVFSQLCFKLLSFSVNLFCSSFSYLLGVLQLSRSQLLHFLFQYSLTHTLSQISRVSFYSFTSFVTFFFSFFISFTAEYHLKKSCLFMCSLSLAFLFLFSN